MFVHSFFVLWNFYSFDIDMVRIMKFYGTRSQKKKKKKKKNHIGLYCYRDMSLSCIDFGHIAHPYSHYFMKILQCWVADGIHSSEGLLVLKTELRPTNKLQAEMSSLSRCSGGSVEPKNCHQLPICSAVTRARENPESQE